MFSFSICSPSNPTSSLIKQMFSPKFLWKMGKNVFVSIALSLLHFGMKQNKLFLPPNSAWVRRAKATVEIFIFHGCSLHKLAVKCRWRKKAPGFLLFFFFSFFFPAKESNMKHWMLCFYSEPPPAPPHSCHRQWKHIWHTLAHKHLHMHAEQIGTDRRQYVSTHTHTHLYCFWASGKCNFLRRMERREECIVEIDAEQITLPAVERQRGQTSVRAFILEHTYTHMLTQEEEGRGLDAVCVWSIK